MNGYNGWMDGWMDEYGKEGKKEEWNGWLEGGREGGRNKLITPGNWIGDRGFFDWLTTSYELMRDWWQTNWKCSWWLLATSLPCLGFYRCRVNVFQSLYQLNTISFADLCSLCIFLLIRFPLDPTSCEIFACGPLKLMPFQLLNVS